MKIESMDAGNFTYSKVNESTEPKKITKPEVSSTDQAQIISNLESKSLSLLTDLEKKELPISDKFVIDTIERANKAISVSGRKLEFSIHEKTKEIMIKVINSDTNEIIREIPSEKILDMVANLWKMAGLFIDEKR